MASRDPLEEEFREFVAARSAALLRTAYLLAGDWATAEDLLQTALTNTYLAWKRLGGIEAVEPYARRVMVNTSTSWWRRRWHGERPTEVLPERPGVDEIERQLDRDVLWRHLKELPSRQRAVLVLRYYEDMSEAQTAALLDISPGTVKSQASRALATLRRRMGTDTPDLTAAPRSAEKAANPRPGRGAAAVRPRPGVGAAQSGPGVGAARSGSVGGISGISGSLSAATPRPSTARAEPRPVAPRPPAPHPIAPAVELPTASAAVPVGTGPGDQQ
ncbi:SigE family RNA polymerase sigma factor [Micromonospora sp. DT4]|uniref:SigE family RNA polymerase sigma factor n=1 Tax=Micromonospora sp. DT4 TaxID=3393438 RepID=UPI003CF82E3B